MRRRALAIAVSLWVAPGVAAYAATTEGTTVSWGDAGFGLRRVDGAQAQGPAAIALDGAGRGFVLDRLHGRVVRVGARVEASLPATEDAELVAVGPDGAVATYSQVRSRVALVSAAGEDLGAVDVPRALGPIRAIALGPSHRVIVTVALQDRYTLGSPRFPLPLPTLLATRQEGAFSLPEGRGVSIEVRKREARLRVSVPGAERAAVTVRPIATGVDAAQLVGTDGATACAKLETLGAGPTIDVTRRLLCVDTRTGAVRLDARLPAPGLYAPRAELAVGGGRVALITPTPEGLRVTTYTLGGGAR